MKKASKQPNKRAVVSVILFICFLILPSTAIVIEVMEEVAPLSFAIHVWTAIHSLAGIVFTVAGVYHTVYNWKSLKRYFTKRHEIEELQNLQ